MSRRNAVPLCHCGKPDDGYSHASRCMLCHPDQPHDEWYLACYCAGHVDKRQAYEAVAIYAGVVALGEWSKRRDDEHTAQAWAEGPYVCPGCHAVAPERCAPGCIDAEIEEDARHEREHDCCECHWEAGDSPCPVHGEDEEEGA